MKNYFKKCVHAALIFGGFMMLTLGVNTVRAQEVYARVLYCKVDLADNETYLKMMHDQVAPALQLAKQNGIIVNWHLYRVAFAGASSEYNYASVLFFDSWAKTEMQNIKLEDLLKKVNPKVDAAATNAKLNAIRKVVRMDVTSRVDFADGTSQAPPKYLTVDFMKPTRGQESDYVKTESELWKPIHKELINAGSQNHWSLWSLIYPGGEALPYSYVTVSVLTDYSKVMSFDYEAAFKKAHPGKVVGDVMSQTLKSRERVRSELWEVVEMTK